jgi:glycosyltransferase involved in cell wall biosynthesis
VDQSSHLDGADVAYRLVDGRQPIRDADVPDADVVIATWWETAEWVADLSPRKGAKVHFIQHHEVFPGQPIDRVEATWRLPFHRIVISRWLADLARERYGDAHTSLVPNAVDHDQFYAPPRGRAVAPTVGLLYSTVGFKGCDVALAVLNRVARRLPGIKLRAFGGQDPVPELPLPPFATYTRRPPQDKIREIYAACDVWLCASRSEGFHLPPLEAMACRCPVVSTRVGGSVEIVDDGVNGYLADVGDVATLSDRLTAVLELPEPLWVRMSRAAHATAARFTWDESTEQFERTLAAAVERAAVGGAADGSAARPDVGPPTPGCPRELAP